MPAFLTYAAVMNLAVQCSGLGGAVPQEFIAGYVMEESGGNQAAWNDRNRNGTVDCGLGQINSSNWPQLGLTAATCKDPCRNMAALSELMRWRSKLATGDPERGFYIQHPQGGSYVAHMTKVADRYRSSPDVPGTPPPRLRPPRTQFVILSSK